MQHYYYIFPSLGFNAMFAIMKIHLVKETYNFSKITGNILFETIIFALPCYGSHCFDMVQLLFYEDVRNAIFIKISTIPVNFLWLYVKYFFSRFNLPGLREKAEYLDYDSSCEIIPPW